MNTFSIKEALRAGWDIWKSHEKVIILATLIMGVVNIAADVREESLYMMVQGLVLTAISLVLHIGWTKLLFKLKDGEAASLQELVNHFTLFWKYFFATLLFSVGFILGFILFVIPGIYFALRYQFIFLSIIDKNLGIKEAFQESARLTQGIKWKLLGLTFVAVFLNILGFLSLGIGLLVSAPVTTLAYIHVYRKLSAPVVGE